MQTPLPLQPTRSRGFIGLMVVLACVSTTFLLATPGFVVLVASQWAYSATQIGMFVTAESVGNALGPLVLSGLLSRAPVRKLLLCSALGFALANLLTVFHPDMPLTLALRLVSGFSSGTLAGLAVRYLALSAHAERNLTWLVISQTLYSTLLLAVLLPGIGAAWQATGAFALLAAQAFLSMPMVRLFGPREQLAVEAHAGGVSQRAGSLIGLAALLGLNTAVGVVWTFIEHQGQVAGLSPEWVGRILGSCNVLSIFACAAVPAAIRRGAIFRWTVGTLLACALAALILAVPPSLFSFIGGSLLFVVSWATAATLMMAAVPLYDASGRYVMLIPSALCIGNGLGAAVGGTLMENLGPAQAFAFAACCCGLSAGLFVLLRQRARVDGIGAAQAAKT